MDGSVVADLKTVVAPLNFLVPMAEKPVSYNYEPPPGVPARTGEGETHQVAIRDARPLIGQLSLDREGFVLLHHQTAVQNFYDEDEIASVYYPECERVIKDATGAARVVAATVSRICFQRPGLLCLKASVNQRSTVPSASGSSELARRTVLMRSSHIAAAPVGLAGSVSHHIAEISLAPCSIAKAWPIMPPIDKPI